MNAFHEGLHVFLRVTYWTFIEAKLVSNNSYREKLSTHFMSSTLFPMSYRFRNDWSQVNKYAATVTLCNIFSFLLFEPILGFVFCNSELPRKMNKQEAFVTYRHVDLQFAYAQKWSRVRRADKFTVD